MSLVLYIFEGRLTKDPEKRTYGADNKTLATIDVASDVGYGDNKKTVYHRCTAFGKSAEAIINHLHKGDQIFIQGSPTQNKGTDGKVYHGVIINEWSFGSKKSGAVKSESGSEPEANPFDDESIPF